MKRQLLAGKRLVPAILEKLSPEHRSLLEPLNSTVEYSFSQVNENSITSSKKFKEVNLSLKIKTLFGEIMLKLDDNEQSSLSATQLKVVLCRNTDFQPGDLILVRNGRSIPDDSVVVNERSQLVKSPKEDIFVLLKPSCSTQCVFNVKVSSNDGSGATKFLSGLSYPANSKIFYLKRELYKQTKISEGAMRLILGAKVLKDEYMLGDYIILATKRNTFPLSSTSSSTPFSSLSSSKSASTSGQQKSSASNRCTIFLQITIDMNREVEINIKLINKETLKFSLNIGAPLIHMRQILHHRYHIPPHMALKFITNFKRDSKTPGEKYHLTDMSKSLYDYGKTDFEPIEIEMFQIQNADSDSASGSCSGSDSGFSTGNSAGTKANTNTTWVPAGPIGIPNANVFESAFLDALQKSTSLLGTQGVTVAATDLNDFFKLAGDTNEKLQATGNIIRRSIGSDSGMTFPFPKSDDMSAKALKPSKAVDLKRNSSVAEKKGKAKTGGLFSAVKRGFLSSSLSSSISAAAASERLSKSLSKDSPSRLKSSGTLCTSVQSSGIGAETNAAEAPAETAESADSLKSASTSLSAAVASVADRSPSTPIRTSQDSPMTLSTLATSPIKTLPTSATSPVKTLRWSPSPSSTSASVSVSEADRIPSFSPVKAKSSASRATEAEAEAEVKAETATFDHMGAESNTGIKMQNRSVFFPITKYSTIFCGFYSIYLLHITSARSH